MTPASETAAELCLVGYLYTQSIWLAGGIFDMVLEGSDCDASKVHMLEHTKNFGIGGLTE